MFPNQTQGQGQPVNPLSVPQQNPLASLMPQATGAAGNTSTSNDALQQQLGLIQLLAAQGIPQEQWATAMQLLTLTSATNPAAGFGNMNPAAALSAFGGQMPGAGATAGGQNAWGSTPSGHDTQSRDRDGRSRDRDRDDHRDHGYMRSPPGQHRRRSRSPGWDRRRDGTPPRRRDSPVYGEYHGDSPGRGRDGGRGGRRGNDYRQRSPPGRGRRRSPTPPRKDSALPPPGPKAVEWDYSIGQGNIKGLSICPLLQPHDFLE